MQRDILEKILECFKDFECELQFTYHSKTINKLCNYYGNRTCKFQLENIKVNSEKFDDLTLINLMLVIEGKKIHLQGVQEVGTPH